MDALAKNIPFCAAVIDWYMKHRETRFRCGCTNRKAVFGGFA